MIFKKNSKKYFFKLKILTYYNFYFIFFKHFFFWFYFFFNKKIYDSNDSIHSLSEADGDFVNEISPSDFNVLNQRYDEAKNLRK